VRTQPIGVRSARGVAHHRSDAAARKASDLQSHGAHAAKSPRDEDAVPEAQGSLDEEGVQCGEGRFGDATGRDEVHALGDGNQRGCVDDHEFGLGATSSDAHHGLADGDLRHTIAEGAYHPDKLEAEAARIVARRRRVVAASLEEVGRVDARCMNLDERFVALRGRVGYGCDVDGAVVGNDGAHVRKATCDAGAREDHVNDAVRIERDTMGEVAVPADALWGAQTQRALENFPVSGQRVPAPLVRALGLIKWAAAQENAARGVLAPELAEAIAAAAAEVAEGLHDDQFPIDVYQTGSGTSTNMNVNEVIARLAAQRLGRTVSPNDHVNASQSSNDTFPTAMHLALLLEVRDRLEPALRTLEASLERRSRDFADVVKAGRTHLMDATPITLGQEFSGYAAQVRRSRERLAASTEEVREVPLGGTAVGTGLNAPPGFAAAVLARIAQRTGVEVREAANHFEVHGARDGVVGVSGALKTLAVALHRIANDVRWMGSGPRCGLAEIHLPDLQPGSSIMPGKVNPVIPESVTQVAARVVGNDATIAFAGAAGSIFELNVMQPVIAHAVLESVQLLASASRLLAERCIDGIEADVDRCRTFALSSPAIATALNPSIGYQRAAEVVKRAVREHRDLRSIVLEEGLLPEEEVDRVLDVMAMTRGGIQR